MLRLVPALLLACALAGAPALAAEAEPPAGEPLFQKHCTTCHPGDRSLQKRKDLAGWQKTIKRMQDHASGLISDEAAAAITAYLVHTRGPKD